MSSGNQTKPLAPGLMLERAKELLESGELDRAYIEALEKDTENALEHDNRCAEDGYYWLTTFVYTFDEHAVGADQIKRFPDAVQPETGARPFEILWCLLKTESQLICIKSRQILQSWLHAAEKLHTALYGGPAVRIPLQSETQELANALLERVAFMYEMLPAWMQKIHPLLSPITTTKIHLQPPHGMAGPGSKIIAIPQGGNKLRSFTNSEVFMDEGAFQPECRDAIKGCKPTISGGGRLHVVTTPNGKEVCYELFTDQPKTVRPKNRGKLITEEEPAKGMLVRRNRNGWCAVRLHYSMVPWRDPDTKEGAAWVEDEKGSTPAADWEQEYEISFEIYDGTPVYGADFKPGFHSAPKIKFREHLPVIRGWDYGYRHPYALIGQKTQAGQLLCIYELLGRDIPIQVFSDVVLWVCGQNLSVGPTKTPDFMKDVSEWRKQQDSIARSTHDERLQQVRRYVDQQHIEGINCFDDLARFNEVSYSKFVDYDDPAGSQHTQMSEFTARQILQLRGIYPSPGEESAKRRVDVTRGALLARHGTDLPGIVISESGCPYLYEAIRRGYRYPPERYGVDSKTIPMKDGLFEHPANGLEYVVTSIHDLDREKYGQPKVARNSILGMRQARERARWANEPLRL